MSTLLPAILLASLLGSPHCAAMCGGFVCFYSGQGGTSRAAHIAYNGGRLVSYLLLGLLAGTIGAGIDVAGRMAGLQRGAAVAAGFVMIAWGGATVATSLGLRLPGSVAPAGFRRLLARALGLLHDRPPAQRALTIGLLTTLLPCGWLYVFVAAAAGTGSPLDGALVMTAFWAGTVPMHGGPGARVPAGARSTRPQDARDHCRRADGPRPPDRDRTNPPRAASRRHAACLP